MQNPGTKGAMQRAELEDPYIPARHGGKQLASDSNTTKRCGCNVGRRVEELSSARTTPGPSFLSIRDT
jgi:hypothetical protein